jgi:hypothetical protein
MSDKEEKFYNIFTRVLQIPRDVLSDFAPKSGSNCKPQKVPKLQTLLNIKVGVRQTTPAAWFGSYN